MSEGSVIRRSGIVVSLGAVLALAIPGAALLLWAEARDYSDNQRNWAYIGGWLGVAGAGIVLLLASEAGIRHHGSRRTQLAFAAFLFMLSIALFATALVTGD